MKLQINLNPKHVPLFYGSKNQVQVYSCHFILFTWNLFKESKLKMQLKVVNGVKKFEMLKVSFMVKT